MRYRILLLVWGLLLSCSSRAEIDPPNFYPATPEAGQPVTMNIGTDFCTSLLDKPHEVDVTVQGSKIEVVIDAIHSIYTPCAGDPGKYAFQLGAFPEGEYEVHVTLRDSYPFALYPSLQVAPLSVVSPRVRTVPIATPTILVLLAAAIAFAAHRRGAVIVMLVVACVPTARAGDTVFGVAVLLGDGSVDPVDLVEDYDFSAGNPPTIPGLAVGNPIRATFLTTERPRGDYAAWLAQHPDSEWAKLERYVVVQYSSAPDAQAGLDALRSDDNVAYAHAFPSFEFSSTESVAKAAPYWRAAVDASTTSNRGWALIGEVDSGIATDHPLLREIDGNGLLTGGSFRAALSYDFGHYGIGELDANVDELEPEPTGPHDTACDTDHDGFLTATAVGHGSHVAGLLVAGGVDTAGVCPGCSLAVARVTHLRCDAPPVLATKINAGSFVPAFKHLIGAGAQAVNQSFGHGNYLENDFCLWNSNNLFCLQILAASKREIAMVAASGNDRTRINFPARDPRMIAVGGLDSSLGFWDDDTSGPDLRDACPIPGSSRECGSNYTIQAGERMQDFVAPARNVLSTIYPGQTWNGILGCGDSFGTAMGDGIGTCTGTSMSAPIVAGIVASVRSANPLLPVAAVKSVLIASAKRPDGGIGWDAKLGYGIPQRDAAVAMALGKVGKQTLKSRVTPLFTLHSEGALDRAAIASPQLAMALMLGPPEAWTPVGAAVPGYVAFAPTFAGTPRAAMQVFTTEVSLFPGRTMVPLRVLRRARAWPLGCTEADTECAIDHVDYLLSTDASEIPQLIAAGYEHLGTQGYAVERCTPTPGCSPPGTVEMLRLCNTDIDDCAVFPRSEEASYAALGYTMSIGTTSVLGLAFPNIDQDGDTLVDGFELALGLNPALPDSDKDGMADGIELPPAGVAVSDPCPRGTCDASFVFADGYE